MGGVKGWIIGALGLLTAGCAATDPALTELPPTATEAPVSAPETSPVPPLAEAYVPPDPTQVVGMRRTDVLRLLGEPSLVRTESTAEIWQYEHSGCVLDLFLYQNGRPDAREVVYFELRDRREGRKLTEAAARYCFGHILRA